MPASPTKGVVLAAERDAAERAFGGVVVERYARCRSCCRFLPDFFVRSVGGGSIFAIQTLKGLRAPERQTTSQELSGADIKEAEPAEPDEKPSLMPVAKVAEAEA